MSECNHVFTTDATCDVCGYGSVYLLEKAQERIQQIEQDNIILRLLLIPHYEDWRIEEALKENDNGNG